MAKLLVKRNLKHRLVEDDQQNAAAPQPQANNNQPQQLSAQNNGDQQQNQQNTPDVTGTINTYLISMFGNIQNDLKTNFVKQVPAVSEAFKNAQSPLNQAAKALNDSFTAFTNIQGLKPEDAQGIANAIEAFSKFLSQLTEFSKQASQQNNQQNNQQNAQQPAAQNNGQQNNQQPQNNAQPQANAQQPANNNQQQPANNQQQNNQQQPTQESYKPSFGEILNENLKYAQFGEMFADIATRYNNL